MRRRTKEITPEEQLSLVRASLRTCKSRCASQEREIAKLTAKSPCTEHEKEIARLEQRCRDIEERWEAAELEIRTLLTGRKAS